MLDYFKPNRGWWFTGAGVIASWILDRIDAPISLAVATLVVFVAIGIAWPWIERAEIRKRLFWVGVAAYVIVAISVVVAIRDADSTRVASLITLFERDPESWPGHTYAEGPLRLDEHIDPPLEIQVGERRRFNPQLEVPLNADNTFDVTIFIYYPRDGFSEKAVEVPRPWQITEDRTNTQLIYFNHVGDYAKGESGLPEIVGAWYLTPQVAGRFDVAYIINGRAETTNPFPIKRRFSITVNEPRP
jgi:hypothetical protein